ncbi:MAG: hypothetical protein JM58_17935 [Peptococcaceae bacterium BICA1-8]|nr:MAG: hypothetical protein JM58_17935 [Peptococcaceae bacterium BICA1-8]
MGNEEFLRSLREEVDNIATAINPSDLGINLEHNYNPQLILAPNNISEIVTIMKLANKYGVSVYPIGSGSKFVKGICPFDEGVLVSLKNINKVVEYRPDNMSVEVESGLSINELQGMLAKDNIFFPIDTSNDLQTIGGIIATDAFGRKKYMYKTTRFYVMGMEFVSPQGEIIKVGGRTIKNVSSYDVHQLLAGSWGALGIITKATLRVKPIPEKGLVLQYVVKNGNELLRIIDSILFKEKLSLASLTFEQLDSSFLIKVELEGFAETLKLQQDLLEKNHGFKESNTNYADINNTQGIISLPLKSYLKGLEKLLELTKPETGIKIKGNATSGLLSFDINASREILQNLSDSINSLQGTLIFENLSLTQKNRGNAYNLLLRDIKNKIDPKHILVPASKVVRSRL